MYEHLKKIKIVPGTFVLEDNTGIWPKSDVKVTYLGEKSLGHNVEFSEKGFYLNKKDYEILSAFFKDLANQTS